jgi:hypothetical protein
VNATFVTFLRQAIREARKLGLRGAWREIVRGWNAEIERERGERP